MSAGETLNLAPLLAAALVATALGGLGTAGALDFCANPLILPIFAGTDTYYAILDHTYLYPDKEYFFSAWVYRESNGIPGIQRDPTAGDPCGKYPGPWDTVIF